MLWHPPGEAPAHEPRLRDSSRPRPHMLLWLLLLLAGRLTDTTARPPVEGAATERLWTCT